MLLIAFPLPSNVPENGVEFPIPVAQLQPDMLMSAVNVYEADLSPVSFNH
jgi:hypothetical protein